MRQIEVINQETIIDVTAETSSVEILVRDYDSELVERFALEAQEAAIDAEESADIATAQASIATAQATIATTQAGIATTQAGNALTSANNAAASAQEAQDIVDSITPADLTEATSSVLTITGGTDAVLGTGTTIQVKQAGSSQSGFLSSTDWTTFNSKQNTITNPVTGTGASGQVAFWNGTSSQTGDTKLTFNSSTGLLTLDGDLTFTGAQTIQTSTGNLTLATAGGNGNIVLSPNGTGGVGIGTASLLNSNLLISRNITGSTNVSSVLNNSTIQSDVTFAGSGFVSQIGTQNTAFTLTLLRHFGTIQGTIGAGSTVTNQYGFHASSGLVGAQSNFGFRGEIPAGATNWNLFMNGTANNHLAGNLLLNTTTDAGFRLDVNGTARVQGSVANALTVQRTTATSNIYIRYQNATNSWYAGQTDTGTFGIGTDAALGGGTLFNLTTGGNLLLGSVTNSGQRLQVTGTSLLNGLSTIQGTTASDSGQLGSELLTTGTGDASWTGTSFATGYTHVAGSTTTLTSTLAGVVSTYYQITYTVTGRTVGSFTIGFGGFTSAALTATGALGPQATTTGTLVITPTSDFNGTIVLSIRVISISSASVTFNSSSGAVTNQIRISSISTNTIIGNSAGSRNTTGSGLSIYGRNAGASNTTGFSNSFFGEGAGALNTIGSLNSFFGVSAGLANTTGVSNAFFGSRNGENNTTGNNNCFFGSTAGFSNTTGNNNSFVGLNSGFSNTTGISNSFFGRDSGLANTTESNNSFFGTSAGVNKIAGANNTFIGSNSGRFTGSGTTAMTSISNSIYLGYQTRGLNATGSTNEIVIGYDVVGLGSNTTVLGNTSTTHGRWFGNLLVGTSTNAGFALDVLGSTRLRGVSNVGTTNALTVSNSDSINLFQVQDNGYIRIGNQGVDAFRIYSTNSTADAEPSGFHLVLNSRSNSQTHTSTIGFVTINGVTGNATTGLQNGLLISKGFAPTSGNAIYNLMTIIPTINQTGGANGITRGLFINPTLTSAADWRGIEVTNGGAYINTTSVQVSAILQADSTTKGFLPPRMTTTQKNAIASPATGLVVYDTTLNKLCVRGALTWETVTSL